MSDQQALQCQCGAVWVQTPYGWGQRADTIEANRSDAVSDLPEPYARLPRTRPCPENAECSNAVILESVDLYTAEQVRELVSKAKTEERERCALTCEDLIAFSEDDPGASAAAAIRGATP